MLIEQQRLTVAEIADGRNLNETNIIILKQRMNEFGEHGVVKRADTTFPQPTLTKLMTLNWTKLFSNLKGESAVPDAKKIPSLPGIRC